MQANNKFVFFFFINPKAKNKFVYTVGEILRTLTTSFVLGTNNQIFTNIESSNMKKYKHKTFKTKLNINSCQFEPHNKFQSTEIKKFNFHDKDENKI
jgi:hypothetical protein